MQTLDDLTLTWCTFVALCGAFEGMASFFTDCCRVVRATSWMVGAKIQKRLNDLSERERSMPSSTKRTRTHSKTAKKIHSQQSKHQPSCMHLGIEPTVFFTSFMCALVYRIQIIVEHFLSSSSLQMDFPFSSKKKKKRSKTFKDVL